MDAEYLRSILLYAPRKGVFYWIKPPVGHAELLGEVAGCVQHGRKPYHVIQIDGKKYKYSRLAYLYMTDRDPEDLVDHANGDSLDDRWDNLRAASVTQNAWNHKRRTKRLDHLPMGVRTNPSGRFSARITVNGEQIQVGTYSTAEEAGAAYQAARRKYYGEFA